MGDIMSKVCCYCIAKNESKFVNRFMDSVKDADLVVVGDTGSTDDTIEQFRARGAVVHQIEVVPWRFDVARNKVIDLVPPEYDCLFSIDIDETIETKGWKQKILAAWPDKTRLRYRYAWSLRQDGTPDQQFTYDKIHSRELRWVSPCHEVLEGVDHGGWVDLAVYHRPDPSKSRGSYLGLLEMAVQERPDDQRILHYYGRELFYRGRTEDTQTVLGRHIDLADAWPAERAESCRMLAECAIKMGYPDQADNYYKKAIQICPAAREPRIFYAQWLQGHGKHQECYEQCLAALQITQRLNHYLEGRYSWEEGPYDLGSTSAYYIGKLQEARKWVDIAYKLAPQDPRIAKNWSIVSSFTADGKTPTQTQHDPALVELFASRLKARIKMAPPAPKGEGRGVVIPAGGQYAVSGYVAVRALRDTGCKLPVEIWYSGDELDQRARAKFEAVEGVVCRNLEDCGFSASQRFGWAIKPICLMNSRFNDILYLDSDIYPLVDPTALFELPDYQKTGAVFRADGTSDQSFGKVLADLWRILGIRAPADNKLPIVDSGVMLLDRSRVWPALCGARFMNDNAPIFYQYCYGDKDTFPTAFILAGLSFCRRLETETVAHDGKIFFRHKDQQGKVQFQHRLHAKFDQNPIVPLLGFLGEDIARRYIVEFLACPGSEQLCGQPAVPVPLPVPLSVVMRVRNRHQQAVQSIPAWLEFLGSLDELIIVDYSDQEGTAQWCTSLGDPRLRIVSVPGREHFHAAHAHNVGIRAARHEWVVLSDSDQLPTEALVRDCRTIPEGMFGVMPWDLERLDLCGFFAAPRSKLIEIGGAEEALVCYGHEDSSIRWSLVWLGLGMHVLTNLPRSLAHSEEARTACMDPGVTRKDSDRQNEAILKILRDRHPYRNNSGRDWGLGGVVVDAEPV